MAFMSLPSLQHLHLVPTNELTLNTIEIHHLATIDLYIFIVIEPSVDLEYSWKCFVRVLMIGNVFSAAVNVSCVVHQLHCL